MDPAGFRLANADKQTIRPNVRTLGGRKARADVCAWQRTQRGQLATSHSRIVTRNFSLVEGMPLARDVLVMPEF